MPVKFLYSKTKLNDLLKAYMLFCPQTTKGTLHRASQCYHFHISMCVFLCFLDVMNYIIDPVMVAYTLYPSIWKAEARGSGV